MKGVFPYDLNLGRFRRLPQKFKKNLAINLKNLYSFNSKIIPIPRSFDEDNKIINLITCKNHKKRNKSLLEQYRNTKYSNIDQKFSKTQFNTSKTFIKSKFINNKLIGDLKKRLKNKMRMMHLSCLLTVEGRT